MRYTITNQTARLLTYDPETVKDELYVYANESGVLKVVGESDSSPWFTRAKNGVYAVPANILVGNVSMCLILDSGEFITLQSVYAIPKGDGLVTLIPDASETLDRLADLEVKINGLFEKYKVLEEDRKKLESRIDKLFEGYNI